MSCKGLCQRYHADRPLNGQRYINGQKKCINCQEWVDYDGTFCPCCNNRLRTRPRRQKDKALFHKAMKLRMIAT
jgi:predicted amidophosphoribosyltransferase